jgi:segregation and condensation protein B
VTQDDAFPHDSLADQAATWVPPWQRAASGPGEAEGETEPAEPVEITSPVELPDIAVEPEHPEEAPGDYTVEPDDVHEEFAEAAGRLARLVEMPKYDSEPTVEPRLTLPVPAVPARPAARPIEQPARPVEQPATQQDDDAAQLAALDPAELRAALEAILLVVDEPVGEIMLAQVLEQPTEAVADALLALSAAYTAENRGFELRRAAGGWRFYTREAYASYVERFVLDGQSVRLTQAALETLAVVAYKQPVTRSRISAIRGVNCDGVVRTLVSRGLIEECGAEPDSGAYLYRTTSLFLEKLGLDGIDQLPALAPFLPDNLEEISDADR